VNDICPGDGYGAYLGVSIDYRKATTATSTSRRTPTAAETLTAFRSPRRSTGTVGSCGSCGSRWSSASMSPATRSRTAIAAARGTTHSPADRRTPHPRRARTPRAATPAETSTSSRRSSHVRVRHQHVPEPPRCRSDRSHQDQLVDVGGLQVRPVAQVAQRMTPHPACSAASAVTSATTSGSTLVSGTAARDFAQ
jgi:hypothetical protein